MRLLAIAVAVACSLSAPLAACVKEPCCGDGSSPAVAVVEQGPIGLWLPLDGHLAPLVAGPPRPARRPDVPPGEEPGAAAAAPMPVNLLPIHTTRGPHIGYGQRVV